jgi:hypothetical protein
MSTIAQIVTALRTTLTSNLSQVDQWSTDEYLPPIQTANTALIIPAFGQQSEAGLLNLGGDEYQTHRIRCEFWVKHNGVNANLTQRARAIAGEAVRVLMTNPTLGGAVETVGYYNGSSFEYIIRTEIAEGMVEVGGGSYCIVTVLVPVTDFNPA